MRNLKSLYHYTSQKGLLGIINDNNLWMTNIFYLNDSEEFTHTTKLIISIVKNHNKEITGKIEAGTSTQRESDLLRKFREIERVLNDFISEGLSESYVFSLSNDGDTLNQWRGYCPEEGGFSIGFDYNKLSSIIDTLNNNGNSERYEIKRCLYEEEEQLKKLESLVDRIDDDLFYKKEFYKQLVTYSSYFKHESFIKENEYRIIYHGEPPNLEKRYTEGRSMIIPYVNLLPPENKDIILPLSDVFVGPTPHNVLSKLSIISLLDSKGYDIDVKPSEIPYRSW